MSRVAASSGARGLWQVHGFRAVLTAHTLSLLGSMISQVAIMSLVYDRAGPVATAAAFGAGLAPHAVVGLLGNTVVRWSGRGLLVGCELGAAALTVVIALIAMPWPLLVVAVAAVSTFVAVFGATRVAVLPELVSPALFPAARAALRVASQLSQVCGYAAGGLVLLVATNRTALLLDAATFVASAIILRLGLPRSTSPGTPAGSSKVPLGRLLRTPPIARLLLLSWVPAAVVVVPEALAAPYAATTGHPGSGIGVLLTAVAAGAVLGELLGVRLLGRTDAQRLLFLTSAPLLLFATTPPLPVAAALAGVAAIGLGGVVAVDRRLLTEIDPELRPRTLVVSISGLMLGQALTAVAAGAAAEALPAALVIAIAGLAGLAAFALLLRR